MIDLQSLLNTEVTNYESKPRTPLIHCMDGTTLSVQTGAGLYCSPRLNIGPWYKVEVGFPSRHFPQLDQYMEGSFSDGDDPTDCVYGYVPIEIVEECIAECGGICIEMTILKDAGGEIELYGIGIGTKL